MAYDPMQGFQVGQEIGKSKKSSLARTAGYMSDLTAQRDKDKSKINPLELMMAKQVIQPDTGVYSWNPTSGQLEKQASVPKGSIVRNTTTEEDIQSKKQAEKGVTGAGAESGKMAFIKTALRDTLPKAKSILFPDGTPASFNRGTAAKSTLWGGGPVPFDKDAQNLYRTLGSAVAARRYMITGQATNQGEQRELFKQFMADWGSTPESIQEGIQQMENEFAEYLKTVDPSAIFHDQGLVNNQSNISDASSDPRTIYNKLRSQGVPAEEAKIKAGIK